MKFVCFCFVFNGSMLPDSSAGEGCTNRRALFKSGPDRACIGLWITRVKFRFSKAWKKKPTKYSEPSEITSDLSPVKTQFYTSNKSLYL